MTKRAIQILIQNTRISIDKRKIENNKPIKVVIFSTQNTDGKSIIQEEFCVELRKFGYQVLSLNYIKENYHPKYFHEHLIKENYLEYKVDDEFFTKRGISDLVGNSELDNYSEYDYVVVEIPSITHSPYPPEMMMEFDLAVMITRANRTWQDADINSLNGIKEFLTEEPVVFLNGVDPEYLQELVGEIPKKRSRIRRIFKKLIRLQVFERYQLKKW